MDIGKLKQGQTIYQVFFNHQHYKPEMRPVFLYSQKQPLPPRECYIDKIPVSYAKKQLTKHGCKGFYKSRRRAVAAYKLLLKELKSSGY